MSINQPLLSYDSIQRIRHYVETKFSYLPKEKHAEIIADAIVKVVEKHLPDFSDTTKKSISQTIIVNMATLKRPILISDIVQAVEQHPLSLEERDCFQAWKRVNSIQSQEAFADALIENQQQATAALQAETLNKALTIKGRKSVHLIYTIAFIALFGVIIIISLFSVRTDNLLEQELTNQEINNVAITPPVIERPSNELPPQYQFVDFDQAIIKSYLNKRQSLLAEEPYFSVIYNTADQFNIHPVLLFAITGQEQGFVPRDHELAEHIVKNPFNVFHSWQDYNTNIEDTTAIAARTLLNLSEERPENVDAIKWINRKYAEDENWHKGVSSLFHTIINHQIHE